MPPSSSSFRALARGLERALASASLLCALGAGLAPSTAAAHGLAPRALAPLLRDDQGVHLLRLTRGLARRAGDGFHYFCPAHFDGYESPPVAQLAGGPAAIALPNGLFLLAADGSSTPYPEVDLGSIVALVDSPSGLYSLALRSDQYELRRLEREHSELLWSAPQSGGDWLALGAGERSLVLLGFSPRARSGSVAFDSGSLLNQLELSASGSELSRGRAELGFYALSVEARVVGDTAYAVVQSESGDRLELGRIADDRWLSLAQAIGNLSGPVSTRAGKRLIALDGALVSFDDEKVGAPGDGEFVTALDNHDGELYASVRDGLRELSGVALGALVFDFATLRGPLRDGLPPGEQTAACETAWQHLQVDLVAAGLLDVDAPGDAGLRGVLDAAAAMASSAADATAPVLAGAGSAPATLADASAPTPSAPGRADGCALWPGAASGRERGLAGSSPLLALASLVLLCARRRRRHDAATQCW